MLTKRKISVVMTFWTGILLIYTFELNSIVGFFVSYVIWQLMRLEGKQRLNKKKLLLIGLLISLSGNYKADEFAFNALIGVTAFQVIGILAKSKKESRQNGLSAVYIALVVYYTLRMTLIFEIPETLMPIHGFYMSVEEYLRANPIVAWLIAVNLVVVNAIILKARSLEDLSLIMGVLTGMSGVEDMTAIVLLEFVGEVIFRMRKGVEKAGEYKKSIQQAGKIYKL